MTVNKSKLLSIAKVAAPIALVALPLVCNAETKDLKTIAGDLTDQIQALANLLVVVAYVAGIGFALGGVIQFKAHKDNPAQVPLSKPITYVAIGAALLFLPTLLSSAGQTIFGGGEKTGASAAGKANNIVGSE